MFDALTQRGFQIEYVAHAKAILASDFPEAAAELESALIGATMGAAPEIWRLKKIVET
jgi:hypothetical protein